MVELELPPAAQHPVQQRGFHVVVSHQGNPFVGRHLSRAISSMEVIRSKMMGMGRILIRKRLAAAPCIVTVIPEAVQSGACHPDGTSGLPCQQRLATCIIVR